MLKIQVELIAPFYSKFIETKADFPVSFEFNKIRFDFFAVKIEAAINKMTFNICWISKQDYQALSIDDAIEKGVAALNHIICYIRTFDLNSTNLILISPRTVESVKLVVYEADEKRHESFHVLTYQEPHFFQEYFSFLNQDNWAISFSEIMEDADKQLLEINLLVDANHAVYEGRFSEAVINCLTAIETHTFPLLQEWLKGSFLNKSEKNAENVLINMTSNAKMELLFGSVKPEYLQKHSQLLEDVKSVNKLRNNIIHKGERASKSEAVFAMNTSSQLILILHFLIEPDNSFWDNE